MALDELALALQRTVFYLNREFRYKDCSVENLIPNTVHTFA